MPSHAMLFRHALSRRSRVLAAIRSAVPLTAAAILAFAAASSSAQPPAEPAANPFRSSVSMLPDSTQGMVAIDDLPQLLEQWTRTSLSDLQHEESLQPFLETQREAIEQRLAETGLQSGLRLVDLRDAVSGELVLAWMRFEAPRRPYSIALLADTRGRDAQRQAMLEKINQGLREREATVEQVDIGGSQATLYTLPQKRGQLIVERLLVATIEGRLIITDRPETMEQLIAATRTETTDGLVAAEDYQGVFGAFQAEAGSESPEAGLLRWFARPIGMATIVRDAAGVDRGRQVDVLELLRNQGFDAVKSAGGQLQFATDRYDLLHRAFVFAPPVAKGPERYRLAARVLQFPNGEMAATPAWVLPTAATLFQAHWKMEEAFWAIETLVDEAFGEKIFRKVIEDIRDDAEGPQIDLAEDVVANFDDHILVLTDNRIVEDETSERVLAAIRLNQPQVVSEAINSAMAGDPDVYKFPYEHHLIWEIRPSQADAVEFDVEGFEDFGFEPQEAAPATQAAPLLEQWAVTVYGDHLIFSSHADLLVEIIEHERSGGASIEEAPAFQRVREAIMEEGGQQRAMERIVRTDLAWRIKYELIRQGRFLESDSLLATLLRRAKEEAESAADEAEPFEIDVTQLPPFEAIRGYLQPAGGFMKTEDRGWSMTHFLLRKP